VRVMRMRGCGWVGTGDDKGEGLWAGGGEGEGGWAVPLEE